MRPAIVIALGIAEHVLRMPRVSIANIPYPTVPNISGFLGHPRFPDHHDRPNRPNSPNQSPSRLDTSSTLKPSRRILTKAFLTIPAIMTGFGFRQALSDSKSRQRECETCHELRFQWVAGPHPTICPMCVCVCERERT